MEQRNERMTLISLFKYRIISNESVQFTVSVSPKLGDLFSFFKQTCVDIIKNCSK